MNNPEISIIVPVYNVEHYIGNCIESILNQSYLDFELILIDDGSTDNSSDICKSFASSDARIKYFSKENGGVSSARNQGIKMSSGKWICFIDSDDYIDKDYLKAFGLSLNDGIDLFAQGYKINKPSGIIIKSASKFGIYNATDAYEILENSDILNSPVFKLYKADIIKDNNIHFDEKLSYGEDHIFSLDYFRHVNTVKIVENCGYNYIVQTGSLTKRNLDVDKLIYYMDLYMLKYSTLRNINKSMNNFAYNIRQYSNFKRLIKELYAQNKLFLLKSKNVHIILSSIKTTSFNLKQKIIIGAIRTISNIPIVSQNNNN